MKEQLPKCDNHSFLPEGIHDYSMIELEFTFSNSSEERANLFAVFKLFLEKIEPYKDEIKDIYIDGKYISEIAKTDDIDILIVTTTEEVELKILEILDTMRRLGIDGKVAVQGGKLLSCWMSLFSKFKTPEHKHLAGYEKGYARLISWR